MVRPGLVRGVNASGEQVWSEAPALSPGSAWVEQVVGDSFGGVVLRTSDGNIGSHSLVRVPGPTSAAPWRWESPYRVENHVAQAPDGTIFVLERSDDGYTFVTGVDGVTGNTRFRHRVPGLTKNTRLNGECLPWLSFESEEGPYTSSVVVGADGAAYLTTKSETRLFNYLPCGSGSGTQQVSVELLRVDANGGMSA